MNTTVQEGQKQPETIIDKEKAAQNKKIVEKGSNKEKKENYIYIGPTVKTGALKTNAMFAGTKKEIKIHLKNILEDIPQVERLLVPLKNLAESKEKVKEKGTLLNKIYQDIASIEYAKKGE